MTHINLLNSYASDRNAEAFAQIIQQYQQFVFATCRRTLHDPADVDDAVQETFLRLAQKAGELHSNVGGWLHRCAANVSVDLNRRRSKRKEHETAAAANRKEGTTDPQVVLAELREHLDLALSKIDDEQRELIIQRYFVGRPQVELAEELGVAPSTITHRLDRAIDALRGHLQNVGHGALSAGGATGLIEILKTEAASSVVPKVLTANLMKIGLTGVTASTGAAAGATILGSAFVKMVLGLAACAVLVIGGIWALSGGNAPPPQTVTVLAQGPSMPATAPASMPAFTVRDPTRDTADAQPPRWETTQPAVPAGVLSGRITDREGNAVSGGTITLSGPGAVRVAINADGTYAIPTIRADGEYRVGVEAPGFLTIEPFASTTPGIQLKRDSTARRDIILERGVPVTVTVLGADGQPIQRAGVDLNQRDDRMNRNSPRRVPSGRDGVSKFTLPVSKNSYVLSVTLEGYAPFHTDVTPTSVDQPIDVKVQLEVGLAITGVAICTDGQPATGWEIQAKPEWWVSNYSPRGAKIDAEGKFILTDIAPGVYALHISIPEGGGMSSSRQLTTLTLPPPTEPLKVNIPFASPASRVEFAGRVHYVGGPKPDSVEVQLSGTGGGEFRMVQIGRNNSTRNGGNQPADEDQFTFENLPKGSYRLQFNGRGIESKNMSIIVPGELPTVELKVVGQTRLAGRVVDETTNQPINHYAVRVRKLRTIGNGANYVQDARWIQVNIDDGRFGVDLVGPGVYQAQVAVDGYAWAWSPEVSVTQGTSEIVLKVGAGGALSGQVVNFAGQAVAGAKVIPMSMARSVSMGRAERFEGDAGAVITGADGRFTLPHLMPGSETIKVTHDNFAFQIVDGFTIKPGETAEAGVIRMKTGGTVEGIAFDGQGTPVAGQTLQFQDDFGYSGGGDDNAGRVASATTDALGHYRVEHLPEMTLWVNVPDRWSRQGVARRIVRPMEGKTARLDFGGNNSITGRIVDPNQKGPRQIVIAAQNANFGPFIALGTADEEGRFAIRGIPPGRYTLFSQTDPQQSNWASVRDLESTGAALDLGEMPVAAGDVLVKLNADDPADLKVVQAVMIYRDQATTLFGDQVSRTSVDGSDRDVWRAKGVPTGKLVASAYIEGASHLSFRARFDRTDAAGPERPVSLRIPRASARLKVQFPEGAAESAVLANEDLSIIIAVSREQSQSGEVKVPPGVYAVRDYRTSQLLPGVAPVEIKDGAANQFIVPVTASQNASTKVPVRIMVWDSSGMLISGASPRLIDAGGAVTDSTENTGFGAAFVVAPGRYRAVLDRAGAGHVEREIDIAAPKPGEPYSGAINLVVD